MISGIWTSTAVWCGKLLEINAQFWILINAQFSIMNTGIYYKGRNGKIRRNRKREREKGHKMQHRKKEMKTGIKTVPDTLNNNFFTLPLLYPNNILPIYKW